MIAEVRHTIAPQTGSAFLLKKGQYLKVIDPLGEQVSDLTAFAKDDPRESLSCGKTLDFAEHINITKGDKLYSNRDHVMLEIIEDTNGQNDMLLAPCSKGTFEIMYNNHEEHPSCLNNLQVNLREFGIGNDQVVGTLNIFMNVRIDEKGDISVLPPRSKAGDYMLLKAEMDLIVGLTACSAEQSNNYSFKPIEYQILSDAI
ncbi:MAG: urea carboxylase-associated family protein [Cyclobacteriaceae bacterium]